VVGAKAATKLSFDDETVEVVVDPRQTVIDNLPDGIEKAFFTRSNYDQFGNNLIDHDLFSDSQDSLPRPEIIVTSVIRDKITPLQEWEGYVLHIDSDTFTARLRDLTDHNSTEEEEVELSLDDLNEFDRKILKEGSIFRWLVGYSMSPFGSKKRFSTLVLRRLPAWTENSIHRREKRTRELVSAIEWD